MQLGMQVSEVLTWVEDLRAEHGILSATRAAEPPDHRYYEQGRAADGLNRLWFAAVDYSIGFEFHSIFLHPRLTTSNTPPRFAPGRVSAPSKWCDFFLFGHRKCNRVHIWRC